ncbi:MAG: 2-isopropylmalate synthase [Clostridiales bacterium]|jgi:2-isopropylmalate synthase|nr:2-isopropylmalate synthase [Clostridiales bacterium]
MSRQIKIFDTTLRDGEQSPGCSMHINEKIELALQLERLGVDVIEAGFAASSEGDFNSVATIAERLKNTTVASLARAMISDIDRAYEAVRRGVSPRIHIFLATSPLHMQYKLKKSEDEVLRLIEESVKYAKSKVSDIEFSAEDASRSERAFLARAFETAIKSGATVVNIPDTVGYCTPTEMYDLARFVKENVKGADKVDLSAHNHNDLGLAVANTLAMVEAGISQVECTVNGIGERAGNAALEEIVMGLNTRPYLYDAETRINTKEIYRTCKLVSNIIGVNIHPTKPIVGANAFAHESGIHQHGVLAKKETYEILSPEAIGIPENKIVLGKHSGKHAFSEHLKEMGYHDISSEKMEELFLEFKRLCDVKKSVSNKDIEALLSNKKMEKNLLYTLINFVINCKKGNAYAAVSIKCGDEVKTVIEEGDGPIDSAFRAIDVVTGRTFMLCDYGVQSVSEGQDALGESYVRLSLDGGAAVTGRGVSTDVIESGILAYIDAVNKLLI